MDLEPSNVQSDSQCNARLLTRYSGAEALLSAGWVQSRLKVLHSTRGTLRIWTKPYHSPDMLSCRALTMSDFFWKNDRENVSRLVSWRSPRHAASRRWWGVGCCPAALPGPAPDSTRHLAPPAMPTSTACWTGTGSCPVQQPRSGEGELCFPSWPAGLCLPVGNPPLPHT